VATPFQTHVQPLSLDPSLGRSGIRAATVDAALHLLTMVLSTQSWSD
jgi:hypothetical protein